MTPMTPMTIIIVDNNQIIKSYSSHYQSINQSINLDL